MPVPVNYRIKFGGRPVQNDYMLRKVRGVQLEFLGQTSQPSWSNVGSKSNRGISSGQVGPVGVHICPLDWIASLVVPG